MLKLCSFFLRLGFRIFLLKVGPRAYAEALLVFF